MAQLPAQDVCQPVGNLIKSASVLTQPDGSVQSRILWDVPDSLGADAVGYIIYKYVGYPHCNNPVDTIYDRNATSYTCSGFNPGGYTIAVYNGSTTPGNFPQYHVPPIIDEADYNACDYTVSLSWSPYVGWDEADVSYKVYAVIDAQHQQLAAGITATSFVWHDAPDNKTIDLYVQAVRKDDATVTSNSLYERVTTTTVQRPAYIALHLTSEGNRVQLTFHIDPDTDLARFEIQRAVDDVFETRHSFSDKTLATYAESATDVFRYRVAAINDCGQIARVSDTLQNFFYVPRVVMPDAVDPLSTVMNVQTGRARNQFGPVINVHPATYAYQLRIINRNGAKIADITKGFNDDPLEKSWNGCFANGVAVPEEVYTYYLEVRFEGGRSENLTGPVMVMYE
jgi:hypothetical protein